MSSTAFFFLLVGAVYAVAQFMRFVLWLDTPKRGR